MAANDFIARLSILGTTTISTGAADAGKIPLLDEDGLLTNSVIPIRPDNIFLSPVIVQELIGENQVSTFTLTSEEETIYLTGLNGDLVLNPKIIVRNGGFLDLDDVEIFHDGTKGIVRSMSGGLNIPNDVTITGTLVVDARLLNFSNLPTSNPNIAGRMWNNSGVATISAG